MKPADIGETRGRARAALGLLAIVVVSALLALWGLDHRYLWDDEAENALLAKRILAVGLPIARDGKDLISQGCGWDADRNYLWTYHPWLPMYLAAASFKLLGVSTLAARLPFAILGVLSVLSLYVVARRLFGDRTLGLLASAALAFSVPFLLHARQSRYYAVAILAAIWMLHFFRATVEGRRFASVGLVAASSVMFHSNHPMFVATYVGLTAAFVALEFERRALARVAGAGAATLLVNAPWVVIYGSAWVVAAFPGDKPFTPGSALLGVVRRFLSYLGRIDLYVLPAVFVLMFLAWLAWERRRAGPASPAPLRTCLFLVIFTLVYLACVSVLPYTFFRFMINLLPGLALLQAYAIRRMGMRRPLLAAALLVLMVTTDTLHGWTTNAKQKVARQRPSSALWNYVDELIDDFHGPTKAIVRHLRAHARPGDRVFISYGDLPLRFYTDLEVRGGQGCQSPFAVPPDWIVRRFFFRFRHPAPGVNDDGLRTWRWLEHEIPWDRYERVELPNVDIVWENNPEPQWHHFQTPAQGPRVVIHHRVR